ncbi:hypothetical protein TARUN_6203 [Trichoderma arundinaceum]|uniref:Uncharacterized protein n=1 Tax=Trichoderma arundinaceum TaxID=490622 RepID=A0A395NIV8_TRIAR|nr:hypothetical protein TARUN_6203 [Trichoderma arundinaceum]
MRPGKIKSSPITSFNARHAGQSFHQHLAIASKQKPPCAHMHMQAPSSPKCFPCSSFGCESYQQQQQHQEQQLQGPHASPNAPKRSPVRLRALGGPSALNVADGRP